VQGVASGSSLLSNRKRAGPDLADFSGKVRLVHRAKIIRRSGTLIDLLMSNWFLLVFARLSAKCQNLQIMNISFGLIDYNLIRCLQFFILSGLVSCVHLNFT
jgi:hypothetical protein